MNALGHEDCETDNHRLETLISRLRQKVRSQLGQDLPLQVLPSLGYKLTQALRVVA